VTPRVSTPARELLSEIDGVELSFLESGSPLPRGDVVHRPYQVWNLADLALLRQLGERVVITQEDLIEYRTPTYFRSDQEWERWRLLTRRALAAADVVVFSSAHASADALAENLVEPDRTAIVPLGVDHFLRIRRSALSRPVSTARLPARAEFLVCLGTDLRHKNRLFALRLMQALQRRHEWDGWLVLAGPHVDVGSSAAEEASFMEAHPRVGERTVKLGAVSEVEKGWLLSNAKVVLYPTVCEGFGLVPFEAAEHGAPCMWAAGTALSDVLPDDGAAIVPWSVEETAERLLALVSDEAARNKNVDAIRFAGAGLRWDATAARLLDVYRRACDGPPPPAVAMRRLESTGLLSVDSLNLLGPGGALPNDLERPLLAVSARPWLSGPLFGAFRLGYRLWHGLRRARGGR
jgi:glycosyltransferase involved in cell wall biosynthesis